MSNHSIFITITKHQNVFLVGSGGRSITYSTHVEARTAAFELREHHVSNGHRAEVHDLAGFPKIRPAYDEEGEAS